MPKRGLRFDIAEYNHIVQHRDLAKKRKDLDARGYKDILKIIGLLARLMI
ncbi:MAG: hypothetical protein V1897_16580 [Pseudomonadota bacterium]